MIKPGLHLFLSLLVYLPVFSHQIMIKRRVSGDVCPHGSDFLIGIIVVVSSIFLIILGYNSIVKLNPKKVSSIIMYMLGISALGCLAVGYTLYVGYEIFFYLRECNTV